MLFTDFRGSREHCGFLPSYSGLKESPYTAGQEMKGYFSEPDVKNHLRDGQRWIVPVADAKKYIEFVSRTTRRSRDLPRVLTNMISIKHEYTGTNVQEPISIFVD